MFVYEWVCVCVFERMSVRLCGYVCVNMHVGERMYGCAYVWMCVWVCERVCVRLCAWIFHTLQVLYFKKNVGNFYRVCVNLSSYYLKPLCLRNVEV